MNYSSAFSNSISLVLLICTSILLIWAAVEGRRTRKIMESVRRQKEIDDLKRENIELKNEICKLLVERRRVERTNKQ